MQVGFLILNESDAVTKTFNNVIIIPEVLSGYLNSIQFNLLRQRKDYSVIKVNHHEFIFTKHFYQTKANKQAKYSKKQITRKFTAKNDKVMFKVISLTGTSHPPIRNDNYW